MYKTFFSRLALIAFGLCAAGTASAAPALRHEVTVTSAIVTVGDMFDDAGVLAEKALFRSPQPGTTGTVSIEAVRQAAALVGLSEFESDGILRVRVARATTLVDAPMLTDLMTADLVARGIVNRGIVVRTVFDTPDPTFNAEAVDVPVALLSLRYTPGNGAFSARFSIAGRDAPIDLGGRMELMVEAPHLVAGRPSGTVLTDADIEMRLVPLKFAESSGVASPEHLIGKQLQRHSHAGLLLRMSDVTEPEVVQRNSSVTLFLRHGPMTLTIKGQALNGASSGQPVQVLNPASKRILHGVATPGGAVEISSTLNVAGL